MRGKLSVLLFMFGLMTTLLPGTVSAADAVNTIDYPDAVSTVAAGINSQGDIVGWYADTGGKTHGFFLGRGGFISIDYPQAIYTDSSAINPAGDIVGTYTDPQNVQHGYLLRQGTFTPIDVPGARFTGAYGINSEGDIVGHYGVPQIGKSMNGYLLRNGSFETYSFVPANTNFMTCGFGINPRGQIVGHYGDLTTVHGFLSTEGSLDESITFPNANTYAIGINPEGEIVGYFLDKAQSRNHGFVRDAAGIVTQIDISDATNTIVRGINARGDIVGNYRDAANKVHGFLIRH